MRFPLILLLILIATSAWGQTPAPKGAPKAAPAKPRTGYLTAAEMPDIGKIVPPPAAAGSPQEARDLAVYRATRAMEGTPRWALALSDNDLATASMLKVFSCSLGVSLTPDNAPRLTALMTKATADWTNGFNTLKSLYGTKRPYDIEPGKVCIASTSGLANSPDYPSGHTTWGWALGLVLTELAPDRATGVLMRAKAYGESRVVCGLHTVSAVEGGMATATAVLAVQHGSAAFRADLEAARAELAGLRAAAAGTPASCALESQALGKSPY